METRTLIREGNKATIYLCLPNDYKPIQLPYFNEWIEALESGNYTQGRGTLCTPGVINCYCCLGVLSEIQGRLKYNGFDYYDLDCPTKGGLNFNNPCFSVLNMEGLLPSNVLIRIYTLPNMLPLSYNSLAGFNDYDESTFQDIAKIIKLVWKPST